MQGFDIPTEIGECDAVVRLLYLPDDFRQFRYAVCSEDRIEVVDLFEQLIFLLLSHTPSHYCHHSRIFLLERL
jgi:hypothetical protein